MDCYDNPEYFEQMYNAFIKKAIAEILKLKWLAKKEEKMTKYSSEKKSQ